MGSSFRVFSLKKGMVLTNETKVQAPTSSTLKIEDETIPIGQEKEKIDSKDEVETP